jgi:hypothetical protein
MNRRVYIRNYLSLKGAHMSFEASVGDAIHAKSLEDALGIGRSLAEYESRSAITAAALKRLSGQGDAFCGHVADLIIADTIPEPDTHAMLSKSNEIIDLNLDGSSMNMLDGGHGRS